MKRVVTWVAGVLGAVAFLVGAAVATWVGPGSVVRLPAHEVAGGSPLTVVTQSLTAYRGTALHVRASTDRGPVLLAAAHPVDVASYVGSARVLRVGQVAASGELAGAGVGDPRSTVPAPMPALDVWSAHTSGPGEHLLEVRLDGAPVEVLVQTAPGARLTLGLGASVPGLFGLAIGVAAGGGLLLLALVVLRRRARRPVAPSGTAADGRPSSASEDAADAVPASVVERVGQRRRATRYGAAVGAGTAALALSGCLALPAPASQPKAAKKVGLSADAARATLADYDRRNNAAIAAVAERADARVWNGVDSGPVLAADRFGTALRAVTGKKDRAVTITHVPVNTYSPAFGGYPMWAVTTVTRTVVPTTDDTDAAARSILLLQRTSARTAWTQHLSVPLDVAPSAPLTRSPASLTAKELAAAVAVMRGVDTYLETGRAAGVVPGASLTRMRKELVTKGAGVVAVGVACQPYLTHEEPVRSLRAVRTSAGILSMMTLQCQVAATPRDGMQIGWSPHYAKALGTTGQLGGLWTRTLLVTAAAESRAAQGPAARVLGARADLVRVADQALS